MKPGCSWVSVGLTDAAKDQGFICQSGGGIFLDMGGHWLFSEGDVFLQYHVQMFPRILTVYYVIIVAYFYF